MVTLPSVGEHQYFIKIANRGQMPRTFWQRTYYLLRTERYNSSALPCGKIRDGLANVFYSFGDFARVSKALCPIEACHRPVGVVILRTQFQRALLRFERRLNVAQMSVSIPFMESERRKLSQRRRRMFPGKCAIQLSQITAQVGQQKRRRTTSRGLRVANCNLPPLIKACITNAALTQRVSHQLP